MSPLLSDIEAQALRLAREDRALLADHLLASVYADREVDEAWAEEVERRILAVEAGPSVPVPAEAAMAKARRTLA